ncbi:hypothetical protein CDAR_516541 [Caerostris darwini]|uniref:Uncharacterized protein n=1 Tax=Caerostris darwini TaxID=1538125 RepID=A0AAV4WWH9_9ARAC|nr:hypothetical protein CDAR_516541 [Caerostris darwini]
MPYWQDNKSWSLNNCQSPGQENRSPRGQAENCELPSGAKIVGRRMTVKAHPGIMFKRKTRVPTERCTKPIRHETYHQTITIDCQTMWRCPGPLD